MSDILCDIDDGVAVVTINRPSLRNSVTYAMWTELGDIFGHLSADNMVRAIILTGAGKDFSAGADIAEFATVRENLKKAKSYEVAVDYACDGIAHATKPVIAVNCGYTLGGGAHLAMSADFRFAQRDAKFGIPAARLSIVYGVQATRKLLALVGLTEAKRILYTAERFDADYALRVGFVDRVCDDPMSEALTYSRDLASGAPLTQGGAKYILNGLTLGTFEMDEANVLIDAAAASLDYAEGRAAFAEKRDPQFKGL